MTSIFKITSIILVLLVSFHVLETDGPCDYEEHLAKKLSSQNSHNQISPSTTEDHEHQDHGQVVPDHLGHSVVLLGEAFELEIRLSSFIVQFPQRPNGKIQHYISENFRPPLQV